MDHIALVEKGDAVFADKLFESLDCLRALCAQAPKGVSQYGKKLIDITPGAVRCGETSPCCPAVFEKAFRQSDGRMHMIKITPPTIIDLIMIAIGLVGLYLAYPQNS